MNDAWPAEMSRLIETLLGPAPETTSPGGMSGASVQRLSGQGNTLILKRSGNPREWHVYTALGATLFDADVAIPEMYGEAVDGNTWWLLLEDVALPLPEDRRLAHPEVIAVLRNLHNIPGASLELPPDPYRPEWPPGMSAQALQLFDAPVARRLSEPLEQIRLASQPLFEPRCPISADPNPANWGLRDDDTPVLFDWERFTLGTPAIDLAISVPGLAAMDAFRAVSMEYAGHDRLATDIARAKVWSVIEFLGGYAAGKIEPSFDISALIERVPAWIMDDLEL